MITFDKEFLTSEEAVKALRSLAGEKISSATELALQKKLRRTFNGEQTALLMEQALLRQKALAKYPAEMAANMYFERQALEQATAWELALHRAAFLDSLAGPGEFLDLGCGIGGDALAMAHFRPVTAIDLQADRLAALKAGAANLNLPFPIRTIQGDYTNMSLPEAAGAFADPARRNDAGKGTKRVFAPEDLLPPLPLVVGILQKMDIPAAVKLSPSFDKSWLSRYGNISLEFTGPCRQCRESVLWLKAADEPFIKGSLLQNDGSWLELTQPLHKDTTVHTGELKRGQYLYETEPVMLRAGQLPTAAAELDAHLFDAEVSWLISDKYTPCSWADAFRIEEIAHFSLKELQKRLRDLDIGIVEIKKRGCAVDPDELRLKLKLDKKSKKALTVLLSRRGGQPIFMLASRV